MHVETHNLRTISVRRFRFLGRGLLRPARRSSSARRDSPLSRIKSERGSLFNAGRIFRLPFIATLVDVFRVNVLFVMN